MTSNNDRKILLDVGDGPEGICIYTSEDRGVSDWSETFPAVYLSASINGSSIHLGPFQMPNVYRQLLEQLKEGVPPNAG